MDPDRRDERHKARRRRAVRLARAVEYARVNLEAAVKRFLADTSDKAYRAALAGRWQELQEAKFAAESTGARILCVCPACWKVHTRLTARTYTVGDE